MKYVEMPDLIQGMYMSKVKKLMNLKKLNKLGIVWNYERKNKNYRNMEYR
jgi:hypothetical protein